MSEQDKKARLRFMQEFDKVVFEGKNPTVTARAKIFASLVGTSAGTLQSAIYMDKHLVPDEVKILHEALQDVKVQKRITDEGNVAFLDPALWLPADSRADWRKAARAGDPLPTGSRRAARSGKKPGRKKAEKLESLPDKTTEVRTQVPMLDLPLPSLNGSSRPDDTQEKNPDIVLESADGAILRLRLRPGKSMKLITTKEGGWEIQLHG